MFGMLPAYGFYVRHAKNIEFDNLDLGYMKEDRRPPFVLDDVTGVDIEHCKAQRASGIPAFVMKNVRDIDVHRYTGVADFHVDSAVRKEM